jgi:hypothetical protein
MSVNQGYEFDGFNFDVLVDRAQLRHIKFTVQTELLDGCLAELMEKLFKAEFFWVHQPDISEMLKVDLEE